MRAAMLSALLAGAFTACSGGGASEGAGDFRLLEFHEAGRNDIPRNRVLEFRFSMPIRQGQDLASRLKIQNVQPGTDPNFSLAIGSYLVDGDRVSFAPKLPSLADRSDAGLRANATYIVFLRAGPDALESVAGDRISRPQEFPFGTGSSFEDVLPGEPPRALGLVAQGAQGESPVPISRLDPRPGEVALLDNAALIAGGRAIEPGAGEAPAAPSPWRFELLVSEPLDPLTVTTESVQLLEIFGDATTTADAEPPGAPPGHFGTPTAFKVPVRVRLVQGFLEEGVDARIEVTPLTILVDDTRYRLAFSGAIRGLDFDQPFPGTNGLTGDGRTIVDGAPLPEPGGLGYVTEFLVRDRPAITAGRTLAYDPLVDGVRPETGGTTNDAARFNTALYNPSFSPGTAVGFLDAFGTGADGDLAVASGTVTIDTGDAPNPPIGRPFTVFDLNPADDYLANPLPGGPLTYDSPAPFEMNLRTLTVSGAATLRVIGRNPILFRVQGLVQVSGTIDVSGEDGRAGGGSAALGGGGGPGGDAGGGSTRGDNCNNIASGCPAFSAFHPTNCGPHTFPHSLNGIGPGRGLAGGEGIGDASNGTTEFQTGTGGGGASHATTGAPGEDHVSAGAAPGTGGSCIPGSTFAVQNSGVVGVRGQPGPTYGDPQVADIPRGGSGGGGGGATHDVFGFGVAQGGGTGGGGGGSISIVAAGSVLATGVIDASGGGGGRGSVQVWNATPGNQVVTGGGGGGAGGAVVIISAADIVLTGALIDARGGTGGARAPTSGPCATCNAGGNGGNGFLFLSDADGQIEGVLPGVPGAYADFPTGFLTIHGFEADRFRPIAAVTELFHSLAADPAYLPLDPMGDVAAQVSQGQTIEIFASSAKADAQDPLRPDPTTETDPVLVARVRSESGATVVDTFDNMDALNPAGPARDAYVRIEGRFAYENDVEAAAGPFAFVDRLDLSYTFNG